MRYARGGQKRPRRYAQHQQQQPLSVLKHRHRAFFSCFVILFCDSQLACHAWKLPFRRNSNNDNSERGAQGSQGGGGNGGGPKSSSETKTPERKADSQGPGANSAGQEQHGTTNSEKTSQYDASTPKRDNLKNPGSSPSLPDLAAGAAALEEALIADPVRFLYRHFMSIVLYEPPVGIVALCTLSHLIMTGRVFRLYPAAGKDSVEAVLQKQQAAKDSGSGRSYVLDEDDLAYRRLGGIDYVRQKLLRAALLPYYQQLKSSTTHDANDQISETQEQLLNYVWNALSVTCPAGSSLRQFAQDMIPPFSHVEALVIRGEKQQSETTPSHQETSGKTTTSKGKEKEAFKNADTSSKSPSSSPLNQLLSIGMTLSEVRLTDALVRLCRDRLLQSTHRLSRTVNHWNRRIESTHFFQSPKQLERDRLRLAYAKAAYQAEIGRLGVLGQILNSRPPDMPEQALLSALQASELQRQLHRSSKNTTKNSHAHNLSSAVTKTRNWWNRTLETFQGKPAPVSTTSGSTAAGASTTTRHNNHELGWRERVHKRLKGAVKMPTLSKYSIQWMVDGSAGTFLSVRTLESNGHIHGPAATDSLLTTSNDHEEWVGYASKWLIQCRTVVCQILHESLKGSSSGGGFDEREFAEIQQYWLQGCGWCDRSSSEDGDVHDNAFEIARDWTRILQYADSLPYWRRVGEGKTVRLRDAAIVSWTRWLNVMGLPLAALQIAIAHYIHVWIIPYWPQLRQEATQAFFKILEILDQRFWVPLKGIYDEIMNRSKGIMSGFGLGLEEKSLDHMLRDLGFGDGLPESRQKALEQAATQYEKDLNQGLLLNFASGRLVRLLLVQVQQLKVGLLSALDTIDVLIKGNQIHFQILAAIPAILIATYGTKLFVRGLYNIRAKDLRPVNAAHVEMTTYLNQLECLVLQMCSEGPSLTKENEKDSSKLLQIPNHNSALLGEALFYMHRYLILLDFASMSVPSRASEDVHLSMLQLLETLSSSASNKGEQGLQQASDLTRNMQWVHLVKERHEKLKQYF